MKEVTPEECKKLQLNILINVAKFCDDHNIKYSLAYGTLIGAIRHKGFIPWDDDIDIIMMRDDYERFVDTYKDDYYQLIHGENMSNHLHVVVSDMSTKLEFIENLNDKHYYKGGLWIDVFPIDYVSDNGGHFWRQRKLIRRLYLMQRYGEFPDAMISRSKSRVEKLIKKVFSKCMHPFVGILGRLVHSLMLSHHKIKTNTVGDLSLWYLKWPSFPAKYMNEFVKVDFEGHSFCVMKEYDAFLRAIYGDYMTPPPVSQQIPKHSYKTYYR